jgi:hypothetical protein
MILTDYIQFAAQVLCRHLNPRQHMANKRVFEIPIEHESLSDERHGPPQRIYDSACPGRQATVIIVETDRVTQPIASRHTTRTMPVPPDNWRDLYFVRICLRIDDRGLDV